MKYILDFDHTLFNTSLFGQKASAYEERGTKITSAIWDIFDATSFLYDDTLDFLKKVGKDNVVILTAIKPSLGVHAREFQETKLEKSGVRTFVDDIIFMEGEKGSYVKDLYANVPTLFLDDTLEQLQSVRRVCPDVTTVQMVRPLLEHRGPISTSKDIAVVTSLADVSQMVASL